MWPSKGLFGYISTLAYELDKPWVIIIIIILLYELIKRNKCRSKSFLVTGLGLIVIFTHG